MGWWSNFLDVLLPVSQMMAPDPVTGLVLGTLASSRARKQADDAGGGQMAGQFNPYDFLTEEQKKVLKEASRFILERQPGIYRPYGYFKSRMTPEQQALASISPDVLFAGATPRIKTDYGLESIVEPSRTTEYIWPFQQASGPFTESKPGVTLGPIEKPLEPPTGEFRPGIDQFESEAALKEKMSQGPASRIVRPSILSGKPRAFEAPPLPRDTITEADYEPSPGTELGSDLDQRQIEAAQYYLKQAGTGYGPSSTPDKRPGAGFIAEVGQRDFPNYRFRLLKNGNVEVTNNITGERREVPALENAPLPRGTTREDEAGVKGGEPILTVPEGEGAITATGQRRADLSDERPGALTAPQAEEDVIQNILASTIPVSEAEKKAVADMLELAEKPIPKETMELTERTRRMLMEGLSPLERKATESFEKELESAAPRDVMETLNPLEREAIERAQGLMKEYGEPGRAPALNPQEEAALQRISEEFQRYGAPGASREAEEAIYGSAEARARREQGEQRKQLIESMAARGLTESGITTEVERKMARDYADRLAEEARQARRYGYEEDYRRAQAALANMAKGGEYVRGLSETQYNKMQEALNRLGAGGEYLRGLEQQGQARRRQAAQDVLGVGAYGRDVETANINAMNAALEQLRGYRREGREAGKEAANYQYQRALDNLNRQLAAQQQAQAQAQQQFANQMALATGTVMPTMQAGASYSMGQQQLQANEAARRAEMLFNIGQGLGGMFGGGGGFNLFTPGMASAAIGGAVGRATQGATQAVGGLSGLGNVATRALTGIATGGLSELLPRKAPAAPRQTRRIL